MVAVTVPLAELTTTVPLLDAADNEASGESEALRNVATGVNRTGMPETGTPFALTTNVALPEGRSVRFTLTLAVPGAMVIGTPADRRSEPSTAARTV
jgi:hypothetical protein